MKGKLIYVLIPMLVIASVLIGCTSTTPTAQPSTTAPATSAPATSAPATSAAPKPTTPAATSAAPQVINVKFASTFPPPPASTTQAYGKFMDLVEQRTNGRVKFEKFWAGSLYGNGDMLEAMGDGRTDFLNWAQAVTYMKTPFNNFTQSIPFGVSDPVLATKMRWQILQEFPQLLQEVAPFGGKPVGWSTLMPMDIMSKKPITSLADLKGQKVGCVADLVEIVKSAGATPVVMPSQERYLAVQQGVLTAELAPFQMSTEFKMYEVEQGLYFTGVQGSNTIFLVANQKSWDKFPADIQKVMLDCATEATNWGAQWLVDNRAAMIKKWTDGGAKVIEMSEADKIAWAKLMPNVPQTFADAMKAKGLPGKELVNRWVALAEQNGYKWPVKWQAN